MVRVVRCGLCGSEKHGLNRAPWGPGFIAGHESSGTVEKAPKGSGFSEGEAVCVHPVVSCGSCPSCQKGLWGHCASRPKVSHGPSNAFAEYIVAPPHLMRRVPAGMDFSTAAMAEPVAVGLHGAKKMPTAGGNAVVFGAGGIGLLVAQALRARGAGRVFVADVKDRSLKAAREIGFETIRSDDPAAWNDLKGTPIHCVYDVVGHVPAITSRGLSLLERHGKFVVIGGQNEMPVDLSPVLSRELCIEGSGWTTREDFEEAIGLLADGRVRCEKMITATYPLEKINEAFAAKDQVKVMIDCGGKAK